MKTAYVTGGTGCVGRNLIDVLIAEGWRVITVYRKSSKRSRLEGLGLDLREVDLHDENSILRSLPDQVDALFHVAANTSHWALEADEQWKDNVLATRNLVNAAIQRRVHRFIFTSTGATHPHRGCTREQAIDIDLQYVRTKRQSEIEVEDGIRRGLDAVVTLPGIVVGAYDYNSYSQIFTEMSKGAMTWVMSGRMEFAHARDVAVGHLRAYERGRTGAYYPMGGPNHTWLEVFQNVARRMGLPVPTKQTPFWLLRLISHQLLWVSFVTRRKPLLTPDLVKLLEISTHLDPVGSRRSQEELGYRSSSLDRMLADCHDWLTREGLLAGSPVVRTEAAPALSNAR
jgi:nucleoside-diphosphate-sugar epimerase